MKRVGTFPKKSIIANQYRVQTYLGEHDCCEVYRVVDTDTRDLKLLKIIQNKLLPNINLGLLEDSLFKYSRLQHQNLVVQSELKSFISDEITHYYFLSSYISGESLEDLLVRKLKLSIFESSQILFPILDTIEYLHSQMIIHKNINPSYMYLDYGSTKINSFLCPVKVSEFIVESTKKINLAYQSNENILHKYHVKNDIFSLMVMFYKCITGVHPWNYDINWHAEEINSIKRRIELHRISYLSTPLSFYEDLYANTDYIFRKFFDENSNDESFCIQELKSDLVTAFNLNSKIQFSKVIDEKTSRDNFQVKINQIRNRKGLQKVAGMDDLKRQLDIDIIQPLIQKDKYQKYGVEPFVMVK